MVQMPEPMSEYVRGLRHVEHGTNADAQKCTYHRDCWLPMSVASMGEHVNCSPRGETKMGTTSPASQPCGCHVLTITSSHTATGQRSGFCLPANSDVNTKLLLEDPSMR